jgi:hypothetical protein
VKSAISFPANQPPTGTVVQTVLRDDILTSAVSCVTFYDLGIVFPYFSVLVLPIFQSSAIGLFSQPGKNKQLANKPQAAYIFNSKITQPPFT